MSQTVDLAKPTEVGALEHARVTDLALSGDGLTVASCAASSNSVHLFDLKSQRLVDTLPQFNTEPASVLFTQFDGKRYLVMGSAGKTIRLWDIDAHKLVERMKGHTSVVKAVAISPTNPALLASCSFDGNVKLWNLGSRSCIANFPNPNKASVYSVAFSPDGRYLASVSADEAGHVWDVESRSRWCVLDLKQHGIKPTAVQFSSCGPEGMGIAVVVAGQNGMVSFWDPTNGQKRAEWSASTGKIDQLLLSRDSKRLMAVGGQNCATVWDISSKGFVCSVPVHDMFPAAMFLRKEGDLVAAAAKDKIVLWQLPEQIVPQEADPLRLSAGLMD